MQMKQTSGEGGHTVSMQLRHSHQASATDSSRAYGLGAGVGVDDPSEPWVEPDRLGDEADRVGEDFAAAAPLSSSSPPYVHKSSRSASPCAEMFTWC